MSRSFLLWWIAVLAFDTFGIGVGTHEYGAALICGLCGLCMAVPLVNEIWHGVER